MFRLEHSDLIVITSVMVPIDFFLFVHPQNWKWITYYHNQTNKERWKGKNFFYNLLYILHLLFGKTSVEGFYRVAQVPRIIGISAYADGGPRSPSAQAWRFARPPIDASRKFSAHVYEVLIVLNVFLFNFIAKSGNF